MTSFHSFPSDGGPHDADSIGQALAGLIRRESGVPKVGMLQPPTVAGVGSSWKVQIGRFVYLHQVDGAVELSGLSEAEQVDIASASGIPAGQARIDRVCWNRATSKLVVLTGTVAASPSAPAAGGLASVATVRVNSGDGMVVAARVAADFVTTELVGSADVQKGRATLSGVGGTQGAAGGASWVTCSTINFPTPFNAPPQLVASAVFPADAVEFMQLMQVTATGFTCRIVRIAHSVPVGGTVSYIATAT